MAEQFKNSLDNPTSTLAAGISAVAVSLTVAAGQGARFPATGEFRVKLTDQGDDTLYELVECTAIAGDVLTIVRAAESANGGGAARAFVAGDFVDLVLSAAALAAYITENTAMPNADYLVGTAQAGLSAEIVVGTTPGGELGNTWASPTVDATHSGSSHAGVQAAAEATAAAALAAHLAGDVVDGDAAGGVLSGTYPNPGFAADMATQVELDAHISDASAAHAASAISVSSATLSGTGTDVQASLEEIDNLLDDHSARHENGGADEISVAGLSGTLADAQTAVAHAASHQDAGGDEISIAGLAGTSVELAAHLTDATDAHDASAISILDAASDFTATEVEGALAELQTADEADEAALAAHLADGSDAHDASAISSVAAGGLVATDVQTALNELDTEKVDIAGDTMTGTLVIDLASGSLASDFYGADGVDTDLRSSSYGSDADVTPNIWMRKARNTSAAPRRTLLHDVLGVVGAEGAYAINDVTSAVFPGDLRAQIQLVADGNWNSNTDTPTRIEIYTTPAGSGTMEQRVMIENSGVGIGPYPLRPLKTLHVVGTMAMESGDEATYVDRSTAIQIHRKQSGVPTAVVPAVHLIVEGKGDNATFIGASGGYISARDRSDVTASNKGVLYGLQLSVVPLVARNNVLIDDVDCLVLSHEGASGTKGTDCLYIGHNPAFTAGAFEWIGAVQIDCNANYAIRAVGTYDYGIDFVDGAIAVFNQAAIRIPNATHIKARNAANSADVSMIRLSSANAVTIADGGENVYVGTGVASGENPQLRLYGYRTGVGAKYALLQVNTAGNVSIESESGQSLSFVAPGGMLLNWASQANVNLFDGSSGATTNRLLNITGWDGSAAKTGSLKISTGGIFQMVAPTAGVQIGTATSEKFATHGSTPTVQRVGAAQVAVATTGATNTTPFGYTTAAQADAIVTLVNEIRATLVEKGLMKGAA